MRPPSENFRNNASTFHSMSVGGRFCGLLKKISYSIFNRRSWESSTFSSSSVVTGVSRHSVVMEDTYGEVPIGHRGAWYGGNSRLALDFRLATQISSFSGALKGF